MDIILLYLISLVGDNQNHLNSKMNKLLTLKKDNEQENNNNANNNVQVEQ